MEQIIEHFTNAKSYREEANSCSTFQAAKKIKLADKALDELERTIEKLIWKVSDLHHENR